MRFNAKVIQDGNVIDEFEVDVSHDENTQGSLVALTQKAINEAFDALKKRTTAKKNKRVRDYISKTEIAGRLFKKLSKRAEEKGEGAVTPKEEKKLENAFGEVFDTNISIDAKPA